MKPPSNRGKSIEVAAVATEKHAGAVTAQDIAKAGSLFTPMAHGHSGNVDTPVFDALVRTKFDDASKAKRRKKPRRKWRNDDGCRAGQPAERLWVKMIGILIAEQDEVGIGELRG